MPRPHILIFNPDQWRGDAVGHMGNLAAVTAIAVRETGPKLAGQVLIYPSTDFRMNHPSHSEPETSL